MTEEVHSSTSLLPTILIGVALAVTFGYLFVYTKTGEAIKEDAAEAKKRAEKLIDSGKSKVADAADSVKRAVNVSYYCHFNVKPWNEQTVEYSNCHFFLAWADPLRKDDWAVGRCLPERQTGNRGIKVLPCGKNEALFVKYSSHFIYGLN